jgi:hypothetical protein
VGKCWRSAVTEERSQLHGHHRPCSQFFVDGKVGKEEPERGRGETAEKRGTRNQIRGGIGSDHRRQLLADQLYPCTDIPGGEYRRQLLADQLYPCTDKPGGEYFTTVLCICSFGCG